ncbi:MAG: hypothetical protein OEQ39_05670 [Gammaproteobacteria bacterium]|nr:hypothetical protein [Gammaproteobacteria bacterium]
MDKKDLEAACYACGFTKNTETVSGSSTHGWSIGKGWIKDGLPVEWFLHEDHPALLPLINELLKSQLRAGFFPEDFSYLEPGIKKATLVLGWARDE